MTVERLTQFLLFLIVTFYLLLDAPRIGAYFATGDPAPAPRRGIARARARSIPC